MPPEGFGKEQERKLKSKKRSLVYQSEEDKWKSVYRILFPDDNDADMPLPYIQYQDCNNALPSQSSNVTQFQEFSRLELPRLVRRALEVVVEQEAQPLEEKLKDLVVEIVKECQTQLVSMFQGIEGTVNESDTSSLTPNPNLSQEQSDIPAALPFQGFASFHEPSRAFAPNTLPVVEARCIATDPNIRNFIDFKNSSNISTNSGFPDAGYDSTWTNVAFPQSATFDASLIGGNEYMNFGTCYGLDDRNGNGIENGHFLAEFDASMWSFVDPPLFGNEMSQGGTAR